MRSDVLQTWSNNLSITRTVCFLFISCARNPRWTKKIDPTNLSHEEHSKYIHSPNISGSLSREPCPCTSQCSSPSNFTVPASWHPSRTHAHNKARIHTPTQAPRLTRYLYFPAIWQVWNYTAVFVRFYPFESYWQWFGVLCLHFP